MKQLVATSAFASFSLAFGISPALANDGQTVPPMFQTGGTSGQPSAEGSAAAQGFLDFHNGTFGVPTLTPLTKEDVVWFPPQRAGL